MIHSIHKGELSYHSAMATLELACADQPLFLTFKQVQEMNRLNPMLLFPAYHFQRRLELASFGTGWWASKRIQMHYRRSAESRLSAGLSRTCTKRSCGR